MLQSSELTSMHAMLFVLLQALAWASFRWLTQDDAERHGPVRGMLRGALHALALLAFRWLTTAAEEGSVAERRRLLLAQVALLAVFHLFAYLAFVWMAAGPLDDRDDNERMAARTAPRLPSRADGANDNDGYGGGGGGGGSVIGDSGRG